MSDGKLADRLSALDQGAAEALLWIDQARREAPSVAQQADSLTDAGRMARLSARRLSNAAGRNNCIGVFGPSQAGKSYLVSALARPRGGDDPQGERLAIRLGAQTRDFLQEINPPGDRESTGLVTRFTIRDTGATASHPVAVRLLTETDIVKILANSFFLDFDPNSMTVPPVEEEDVRNAVAAAQGAARGEEAAHLDDIALYDLGLYFRAHFKSRIGAFDRTGFWRSLIELGGRLPLRARADLFSLLWGRLEEFTSLYLHLVEALESIGHATDAHVAEAGMIPREVGSRPNSIIDVAVLQRLRSEEDAADRISMKALRGGAEIKETDLPRATLTALIAEVALQIDQKPWPFFDHADLLDFPGARSRLKLREMPADPAENVDQTRELYLRGKIAYLFQRNTDELELTSMLLCMPPSVAEVKDLSSMVQSWIAATHGATPDRRKAVRNALFLILTKHDMEFQEKGGETDESRRGKWDRRLHASLLELYGKDGWPNDWDGTPFDNTFFLRNPGMKQVHLMRYGDEDALIEAEPVDNAAFRTYREGFLADPGVAKHFRDPPAVWEAALKPNDGGVSYLVENIVAVLDPGLKAAQARERLDEAAEALASPLRGLYHAEGDAAKREVDDKLVGLRRALNAAFSRAGYRGFAHMQRALTVDPADVRGVFMNVGALKEDAFEAADAPADDPFDDDPWADDAPAVAPAPVRRERPEVFAEQLVNHWASQLRAVQGDDHALTELNLSAQVLGGVIDELLVGASRAELVADLAEIARDETKSAAVRWPDVADRVSMQAATRLNDFVAFLGYDRAPSSERPGYPEAPKAPERAVFTGGDLIPPGLEIGDERAPLARAAFIDWGVAFRAFGNQNVSHSAGREISEELNRRLGDILRLVDGEEDA